MRSTSWITSRARDRRFLRGGLLAFVALTGLAQGAPSPTLPCTLSKPAYRAEGTVARFEVTLDCRPGQAATKPVPVGVDLLVGLTVYANAGSIGGADDRASYAKRTLDAPAEVRSALANRMQSKAAFAGGPKWIVLNDADNESYDFKAQVVRIDKAGAPVTLRFEDGLALTTGKNYVLFAVWPASARRPCEKSDYARSGCRRDGYVIGDGNGVSPLLAYPGLETHRAEPHSSPSESWIVERFR